jgi:hypothetical protein
MWNSREGLPVLLRDARMGLLARWTGARALPWLPVSYQDEFPPGSFDDDCIDSHCDSRSGTFIDLTSARMRSSSGTRVHAGAGTATDATLKHFAGGTGSRLLL